ncbi:MAG: hypothetical protein ACJ72N_19895 [Labedaea sp.]
MPDGVSGVAGDAVRPYVVARPAQNVPHRLHTVADLFVELGVTQLPEVDSWPRQLAERVRVPGATVARALAVPDGRAVGGRR